MTKFTLAICSTAILLITLTACPYGGPHRDESQNSPAKTSTTTSNPRAGGESRPSGNPVMPAGQQAAAAAPAETQIQLIEYSIVLPPSVSAGPQHFTIANGGKQNHSLVIEGNGVSAKLPDNITRGDTTTLDVDLKPGTYTVWCPVDGHRAKGMQTTLTVK